MPTKLKGLKIKRVALVDEGANPDAHIRFAKRKDGDPAEIDGSTGDAFTEEQAQGLAKRIADAIVKFFRPAAAAEETDPVSKDAHTFSEAEAVRNYDVIMDKEVWPMIYAMADSIRSILFDTDKSDADKETLLKTSGSEFAAAIANYAGSWSGAKLANATIAKTADDLAKMRDEIDAVIAKANTGGDEPQEDPAQQPADADGAAAANADNNQTDGSEGSEPSGETVTKGVTDMKFNTEAMTPEERAQFEDFAKRYGTEEATDNNPAPGTDPAPADDVVKGMRTELEELRKFKEAAEDAQLLEVAKKYTLLGKKPEELAKSLKAMKAAGGTAYDDMIAVLDSSLKAVEESGTFSEIGKRGGSADNSGDAWAKIETAASEIRKAKPDMTWADAIDQACIQHPELVEQYEKSRG